MSRVLRAVGSDGGEGRGRAGWGLARVGCGAESREVCRSPVGEGQPVPGPRRVWNCDPEAGVQGASPPQRDLPSKPLSEAGDSPMPFMGRGGRRLVKKEFSFSFSEARGSDRGRSIGRPGPVCGPGRQRGLSPRRTCGSRLHGSAAEPRPGGREGNRRGTERERLQVAKWPREEHSDRSRGFEGTGQAWRVCVTHSRDCVLGTRVISQPARPEGDRQELSSSTQPLRNVDEPCPLLSTRGERQLND